MQGDPYSVLARCTMPQEKNNSARIGFGTVLSADPISISVGGLPISSEYLRINAGLLSEPIKTEIAIESGEAQGSIQTDEQLSASFTFSSGEAKGTIKPQELLQAGDRVLLYTEDDQIFYILCKVVAL